ncbi:hypothetical protein AB1Y20_001273 [Prymnesium parvum]|uniref:Uncharacterized protein n=1 Tax=Prymnesium parvum TaxID=97485 RepID=A0AB34KD37_PRYPA
MSLRLTPGVIVASYDDHWIYYPVCRFDPKKARLKLDKENRQVWVGPATKVKVEYDKGQSDIVNGGNIKLHSRADLERGYEWDPKMDKENPMPRLKIWKMPPAVA